MPENDPFDSFKAAMTSQTSTTPLPATEVRRRGDRLRRRNTALAVAGGTVAAMTAIGVPVALTQGDGPSTDGMVATDPAPQWRTEVPEGFPITDGFPQDDPDLVQVLEEHQPQNVGPCLGPVWDVSGALDSLQAVYTDPSEGGLDRTLSVFADEEAAAARVAGLREEVQTCEPSGQVLVQADLLTSDLGEESVVFVNRYLETFDGVLHEVVRVGNAVLYSTSHFNGSGDPAVVEETRELEQQRSAVVVSEMCVFSADPC